MFKMFTRQTMTGVGIIFLAFYGSIFAMIVIGLYKGYSHAAM